MNKQQNDQLTSDQITKMLRAINTSVLGDWEKTFVTDVRNYFDKNGRLSEKQGKRLTQIWRKQINDPKLPPAA